MFAERKSLLLYMAKCITAVVVVFGIARWFAYQEIIWPLVSAILVRTTLPRLRISSVEPMDWSADLLALYHTQLEPALPY